ncbi:MAG: thioredoxin family protein [Bacteroidota bacterium]
MKILSVLLLSILISSASQGWLTDFDSAKKIAKEKHQFILLNFSGSDWCGTCIRLHKEIFKSEAFIQFADSNLVLVNADFPRYKKNKLKTLQLKKNEALAAKYNPKGVFPYTLLLNEDGEVIKIWNGYPNMTPDNFIEQIKAKIDAN